MKSIEHTSIAVVVMMFTSKVVLDVSPDGSVLCLLFLPFGFMLYIVVKAMLRLKVALTSRRMACPMFPWRAAFTACASRRWAWNSARASCCTYMKE